MVSILPFHIQSRLQAICTDNMSSASSLAEALLTVFTRIAESGDAVSAAEIKAWITRVTKEVVHSHAAMAQLFNVSEDLVRHIERLNHVDQIRQEILSYCATVRERLSDAIDKIAEFGAEKIQDRMTIAVHSRSAAVESLLLRAHTLGKQFTVCCFESRPMMEGRALAAALAHAGIHATLAIDAAMASMVPKTDLVLVGADGVTADGIVNKIGTLALANAAKNSSIDCYSCFSIDKVFPSHRQPAIDRQMDPREVIDEVPPGVHVVNIYFDLTPFSLFRGYITEKGIVDESFVHAVSDRA